ncbi:MAG: hypothetical protein FWF81_13530 [Defluviitaleaceae bacterium]|nr:hypothetical protein [Defluviitaleaceae bacterium]
MFDYSITYEEEMEIRMEEAVEEAVAVAVEEAREQALERGILSSAIELVQKGISLQEVINMLDLTDRQAGEIRTLLN